MQLGFSRRRSARLGSNATARRHFKRRRLSYDHLEDRRVLSVTTPGTEFQVPTAVTGVQLTNDRSVAMDSNGNAVVAWADSQTTGSNGLPSGPWSLEFQLYTNNSGTLTAVAGGPVETMGGSPVTTNVGSVMVARAPTSGDFAVVWGAQNSTYAQLYSAAGTPLTDPILVGSSGRPVAVAMNDSGFDVLYGVSSKHSSRPTETVQRYSSSGAAEGSPISVVNPLDQSSTASISMDATGNFVVAWSDTAATRNGYVYSINAQRYTSAGKSAGSTIQVAEASFPFAVNVGMDAQDDFVVTWWGSEGLMMETVYADNSLAASVATDTSGVQGDANQPASMAMQPSGNFALSWVDYVTTGGYTVHSDTFLLSGAEQQSPITVYTTTNNFNQQSTSAAVDANGDLLVIYSGYGAYSPNPKTTPYTIYTDGGVFGVFYLDPPPPATASSSSSTSSSGGGSTSGGSTTAAADAVFAAYPGDEER